jgi:hypothetical protein
MRPPNSAASTINVALIVPKEAVPCASPRGGPAQRQREEAKPAEAEQRVQRAEPPGDRRGGFAAQMHKREPCAQQHGAREDYESGGEHGKEQSG